MALCFLESWVLEDCPYLGDERKDQNQGRERLNGHRGKVCGDKHKNGWNGEKKTRKGEGVKLWVTPQLWRKWVESPRLLDGRNKEEKEPLGEAKHYYVLRKRGNKRNHLALSG